MSLSDSSLVRQPGTCSRVQRRGLGQRGVQGAFVDGAGCPRPIRHPSRADLNHPVVAQQRARLETALQGDAGPSLLLRRRPCRSSGYEHQQAPAAAGSGGAARHRSSGRAAALRQARAHTSGHPSSGFLGAPAACFLRPARLLPPWSAPWPAISIANTVWPLGRAWNCCKSAGSAWPN